MSTHFSGAPSGPSGEKLPSVRAGRTSARTDRTTEPIPPFSDLVEMECEDCGGTGYDFGSTREFDPEDCPRCSGSGTELVFRNYLAEAFHMICDPECRVELCREHIVAMATYARQTVSALFSAVPTSATRGREQSGGGDLRW